MALPFQQELETAKYITDLLGISKQVNPNYSGAVIKPDQVAEMSPNDLTAIMTEFLRTDGRFLDQMRQQNLSGLYNSSARTLTANDLVAQAALKAAQANIPIKQGNTQLQNAYYARVSTQPQKYLPSRNSGADKALALALAYLNKDENKKGKPKSGQQSSGKEESGNDPISQVLGAIGGTFEKLFGGNTDNAYINPNLGANVGFGNTGNFEDTTGFEFSTPFNPNYSGANIKLGGGFSSFDSGSLYDNDYSFGSYSPNLNYDFSPSDYNFGSSGYSLSGSGSGFSLGSGSSYDFGSLGNSSVYDFGSLGGGYNFSDSYGSFDGSLDEYLF